MSLAAATERGVLGRAAELEEYLGDPWDPGRTFSFHRAVALDEEEAYPEAQCERLDAWGLPALYVPPGDGGELRSMEELIAVVRSVSRRDLTVAVAHAKTLLGALGVWIAGSAAQRRWVAAHVRAGRQLALALSERNHGSDLLADEVGAVPEAEGHRLEGEKWPINNATRSAALTVLARTGDVAGPRSLSLFRVDKGDLDPRSYEHLPKILTHGIRGADISGIRFHRCHLPPGSLVGPEGSGLETTLQSFQVSRTMCAGLSLGAGDTALRLALGFALEREVYGGRVIDLPHVRRALTGAFADLLACELATGAAARGLQAAPHLCSLWSSIVKYQVPETIDSLVHETSLVLGARSYVREWYADGVFQKLSRDNAIVGLFDGSKLVNLGVVGLQLRALAERRGQGAPDGGEVQDALETLFRPDGDLPPLGFDRLELSSRGQDPVVEGLAGALEGLDRDPGGAGTEVVAAVGQRCREMMRVLEGIDREILTLSSREMRGMDKSPQLFDLARRYCAVWTGAACLHSWLRRRRSPDRWLARGAWLPGCLDRALGCTRHEMPLPRPMDPVAAEALLGRLQDLHSERRMFSTVPLRLGETCQHGREE